MVAMYIVAVSLGYNANELVINCTSLQRQIHLSRIKKSQKIKNNLMVSGVLKIEMVMNMKFVLQFLLIDEPRYFAFRWKTPTGKNRPLKRNDETVIVSYKTGEQLIRAPKLSAATDSKIADAFYELLFEWNLKELVVACCLDTISTKTGIIKGVATLLKKSNSNENYYICLTDIICINFY